MASVPHASQGDSHSSNDAASQPIHNAPQYPRETFTDVVVVGAGVSGLRAANELLNVFQLQTVVLEARDIIGGRVRQDTTFLPGAELEMGAEFIHGDINQPTDLAEEFHWGRRQIFTWSHGDGGPSKRPAPDGGVGYYFLGKEDALLRADDEDAEFKTCNRALWELGEVDAAIADADKRNLREYLRDAGVGDRFLSLADAGYCNTQGGTLDSVPVARACKQERAWEGDGTAYDPDFRMSPSYSVLIKHLAQGLTIRTSSPVQSIVVDEGLRSGCAATPVQWDGSGSPPHAVLPARHAVTVTCKDGSIVRAHRVIVTVPLPILRDQEIRFQPPLSQRKVAAAQSLSFANGVKVILKFNRRPWPADCHGVVCADSFIPECWMNGTRPAGSLIIGKANYTEWCDQPLEGSDAGEEEEEAAALASGSVGSGELSPEARHSASTAASDCGSTGAGPSSSLLAVAPPAPAQAAPIDRTMPPVEPGVFYLCTGFAMGGRADDLAALPQETVLQRFLAQLSRMFGMDAASCFLDGYVHSWADEPYIRGAYATPTVRDDVNAAKALAEPHLDTLFFAGEATAGATDAELRSTSVHFAPPIVLHGAMETGSQAACLAARSLGLPVACVMLPQAAAGGGSAPLLLGDATAEALSEGALLEEGVAKMFLRQQRLPHDHLLCGGGAAGSEAAAVPCIHWRQQQRALRQQLASPDVVVKHGYASPIIPVSVSLQNLLLTSWSSASSGGTPETPLAKSAVS